MSTSIPVLIVSPGLDQRDHRVRAVAHLADGSVWISRAGNPDDAIDPDDCSVIEMPLLLDAGRREIHRQLSAQGWQLV